MIIKTKNTEHRAIFQLNSYKHRLLIAKALLF